MSARCPCLNSKGKHKGGYKSKQKADDVAAHRQSEDSKVALKVYKCPHSEYWHLAKNK